jgi:hypothetical protein
VPSERLREWRPITGQSAQVDSGYIAQHLVSLVSGISGVERRGKGLDLRDGGEVKTANAVDAVDKGRWNLQFVSEETMDALLEHSRIWFVLFDVLSDERIRARIWTVDPRADEGFREAFTTWRGFAGRKSRNFQLHPPIGTDDDVATNLSGNLRLPKIFEARLSRDRSNDELLQCDESTDEQSVSLGAGRYNRVTGVVTPVAPKVIEEVLVAEDAMDAEDDNALTDADADAPAQGEGT